MTVTVDRIKQGEDIIGASLVIEGDKYELLFSLDMEERQDAIEEETGVVLDHEACVSIERLCQEQMIREAQRVLAVLDTMEPSAVGCVARVNGGTWHVRVDESFPGELAYSETFSPSCQPGEMAFALICDIDSISAVELFEVAEELRGWLRSPKVEHHDPNWLDAISRPPSD